MTSIHHLLYSTSDYSIPDHGLTYYHNLHHHNTTTLAASVGAASPMPSAPMLHRSSSATSQFVVSQLSSQITSPDDDADFGDSSSASRPPDTTAPPPLVIPRLETPERAPPCAEPDDAWPPGSVATAPTWHTWGSDLELAASPPPPHDARFWKSPGGFADFLSLPPAPVQPQGTTPFSLASSPLHYGDYPPWSPSLLDLNLHVPAVFQHLFANSSSPGDAYLHMPNYSVQSSHTVGGTDAGIGHPLSRHVLGGDVSDPPPALRLSEISRSAGEDLGCAGVGLNVLQMLEDGSCSAVDCFPLDCFGLDLSSCSSNFLYPDQQRAAAQAQLYVDASESPSVIVNQDPAISALLQQQRQPRSMPELRHPAAVGGCLERPVHQSSDLFSGVGGLLPAAGSMNHHLKHRQQVQQQYSMEPAYSASTTTTATTTSGDVCWEGARRRRRGGVSKPSGGGGAPVGAASHRVTELTLAELSQYFNMPITQASKELKVGLTVLKKKCREFGIPRWPHRKMKSLDSLINNIQDLASEQGGKGSARVLNAVKELEEQKRLMEEMPGIELAERTKRLRQACFKASYKKRRLQQCQQEQQQSSNELS